jgi:hypothetical protein
MADRYEDRRYISDDEVVQPADPAPGAKKDGDPLAELAKLIGQTDPFANFGRANPTHPLRRDPPQTSATHGDRDPDADEFFDREIFDEAPKPPAWVQHRAEAMAAEQGRDPVDDDLANRPHPLRRFAPDGDANHPDAHYAAAHYPEAHDGAAPAPHHMAYQDDPYAYQDDYGDQPQAARDKSRRGLLTVAAVLGLAVIGTGGAFAYRTFVASPRSGDVPVIKADPNPIKVVPPTTAEAANKAIQDRMGGGSGETLVPREEQPVDVRDPTKAAARPPTGNFAKGTPPASPSTTSGTLPNQAEEPRKVRTFTVKGDQSESGTTPLAKQPSRAAATTTPPPSAPAPRAPSSPTPGPTASLSPPPQQPSAPLSLSPRANPAPTAAAPVASGGYVVQVSSQRSESDARASYASLQQKFPSVLGSRSASIKRADLGEKGTYYRAILGPFSSPEDAAALCGNLKSAGGQCVVQRN